LPGIESVGPAADNSGEARRTPAPAITPSTTRNPTKLIRAVVKNHPTAIATTAIAAIAAEPLTYG
jgi:hypothetical protein